MASGRDLPLMARAKNGRDENGGVLPPGLTLLTAGANLLPFK